MNFIDTPLNGLLIVEAKIFRDNRGEFFEVYRKDLFDEAVGYEVDFVQENQSLSQAGTLRGMHWQIESPQGKLVRVLNGRIIDVAVDIRVSSPTFKKYFAIELSAENKRQLWIPRGFAHGFIALEDCTQMQYKVDNFWNKKGERSFHLEDKTIAIDWGDYEEKRLSEKDMCAPDFESLIEEDLFA